MLTIYHNPRCSKSRQALQLLTDAGHEPKVVEYLKQPLDADALSQLMKSVGGVSQAIRKGERIYKELGLNQADDSQRLAAMHEHPILMERPIVVGPQGAKVCRPPELALELL